VNFKNWCKNIGGVSESSIKNLKKNLFVSIHSKINDKIFVFSGYIKKRRGTSLTTTLFVQKYSKHCSITQVVDVNSPNIVSLTLTGN
jgi:ribosomal protein L19